MAAATSPAAAPPISPKVTAAAVDHDVVRAVVGQIPPVTPLRAAPTIPPAYQQGGAIANSELSPLIASLTGGYTALSKSGAAAIKNATAQYAATMAGEAPALKDIYGTAETADAAGTSALADRLSGAGQASSDALAARLASINEPGVVNPVAASLAGAGAGAAGGVAGIGTSSLAQLIADSAHAQEYATKLPGIASASGVQNQTAFQSGVAGAESKALAPVLAKAPGLEQSAASSILTNQQRGATTEARDDATQAAQLKTKAATIIATNIDPVTGRLTPDGVKQLRALGITGTGVAGTAGAGIVKGNQTAGEKAAALAEKTAHDATTAAQGWARVSIAQTNAGTAQGRLALARAKQAQAAGKTSGGLTADETAKLIAGWTNGTIKSIRTPAPKIDPATGKQAVVNGVPQWATNATTGAPIMVSQSAKQGTFTYQQQISALVGLGKTPADAQKAVDGSIAPGSNGRPWLEPAQTAILSHTGALVGKPGGGTAVRIVNGHGVLDPSQYAALKAANKLPPGTLSAEGFYVIGT